MGWAKLKNKLSYLKNGYSCKAHFWFEIISTSNYYGEIKNGKKIELLLKSMKSIIDLAIFSWWRTDSDSNQRNQLLIL